jgi:hypothetical protein
VQVRVLEPLLRCQQREEGNGHPWFNQGRLYLGVRLRHEEPDLQTTDSAQVSEQFLLDEHPKDLLVYSLGDYAGEQQPQLRTVLAGNQEGTSFFYKNYYDSSKKVFINSLYIDGMVLFSSSISPRKLFSLLMLMMRLLSPSTYPVMATYLMITSKRPGSWRYLAVHA